MNLLSFYAYPTIIIGGIGISVFPPRTLSISSFERTNSLTSSKFRVFMINSF